MELPRRCGQRVTEVGMRDGDQGPRTLHHCLAIEFGRAILGDNRMRVVTAGHNTGAQVAEQPRERGKLGEARGGQGGPGARQRLVSEVLGSR
jgi:hypothetical protein